MVRERGRALSRVTAPEVTAKDQARDRRRTPMDLPDGFDGPPHRARRYTAHDREQPAADLLRMAGWLGLPAK